MKSLLFLYVECYLLITLDTALTPSK